MYVFEKHSVTKELLPALYLPAKAVTAMKWTTNKHKKTIAVYWDPVSWTAQKDTEQNVNGENITKKYLPKDIPQVFFKLLSFSSIHLVT